jgi:hypothetical protein
LRPSLFKAGDSLYSGGMKDGQITTTNAAGLTVVDTHILLTQPGVQATIATLAHATIGANK